MIDQLAASTRPSPSSSPIRILRVGTRDFDGGAERTASSISEACLRLGIESSFWVGFRQRIREHVRLLAPPRYKSWMARRFERLHRWALEHSIRGLPQLSVRLRDHFHDRAVRQQIRRGREDFDFPATADLLRYQADLIHCHNLHGGYFDLRYLPALSAQRPVILTLHDAWLLSGHCVHSFGCERWKTGCGQCPDLAIPIPLQTDGTSDNWKRKRQIYQRSRLYIGAPCQWLMDKVSQSMLAPAVVESRVIPHGVDQQVFRKVDQSHARHELGIDSSSRVLLFAANRVRENPYKDFATLEAALKMLAETQLDVPVLLLALGQESPALSFGSTSIRFISKQVDNHRIARHFQAADIYVHPARADTFPRVVLEALSCGVPVVATAVGGIPEQVKSLSSKASGLPSREGSNTHCDEATGILVPPGDPRSLAHALRLLIENQELCRLLGDNAGRDAALRFNEQRMICDYVAWYHEILVGQRKT